MFLNRKKKKQGKKCQYLRGRGESLERSCKNKLSLKYNFMESSVHFSEKFGGMSLYRKKKV